jgi:TPR repeat protein
MTDTLYSTPSGPELGSEEVQRLIMMALPEMVGGGSFAAASDSPYHGLGLDLGSTDAGGDALQFEVAIHIVHNAKTPLDKLGALGLLRDLAKRGYLAAFRAAGLMTAKGEFGPPDHSLARSWLECGVAAGSVECLYELAQMAERSEGGQAEAGRLYELSAEAGDPRGQLALALRLAQGLPVKDDARAFALLLDASERGCRAAYYSLGLFYEMGMGVAKNPIEAYRWYARASEDGSLAPLDRLARLCVTNPGAPGLLGQAFKWASKAAEKGSATAGDILGKIHAIGLGVPVDVEKAVECFMRSAEAGYALGLVDLLHVLSKGHAGRPPDPALAVQWAMRGVEMEMDPARLILAGMYREGAFLERDEARAAMLEAEVDPGDLLEILRLLDAVEREFMMIAPEDLGPEPTY